MMTKENCISEGKRWSTKTQNKYFAVNENNTWKLYSENRVNNASNIDKIDWSEVIAI
jgi:hypothetical protein